jgi:hypothetical protein
MEIKFTGSVQEAMRAIIVLMAKKDSGICADGEFFNRITSVSTTCSLRKFAFFSRQRTMAFVTVEKVKTPQFSCWILYRVEYFHVITNEKVLLKREQVYGK